MTSQELGDLREMVGQKRVQPWDVPANGRRVPADSLDAQSIDLIVSLNKKGKPSKYKAVRCQDADGNKFDSKAELARWNALKLKETLGQITALSRQPQFPLIVNGVKCGKYIADFEYTWRGTGVRVIEDVKGVRTPVYRLKKRIVEALYKIKITEVK